MKTYYEHGEQVEFIDETGNTVTGYASGPVNKEGMVRISRAKGTLSRYYPVSSIVTEYPVYRTYGVGHWGSTGTNSHILVVFFQNTPEGKRRILRAEPVCQGSYSRGGMSVSVRMKTHSVSFDVPLSSVTCKKCQKRADRYSVEPVELR